MIVVTLPVVANPSGGSVVSGAATIQTNPGSVLIKQGSSSAIINWQSFSINPGETTRFLQPNSQSAALNRVLGGGASLLNGNLFANGQVFIINQNGILIGPSGFVNVAGGFTASTRNIGDADFLDGKYAFKGHGKAGVKNLGEITSLLGDVVLIGKTVDNHGQITANRGSAELIAGENVLLGQRDGIGNTITVSPAHLSKTDSKQVGVNNTGQINAAAAQLKAADGNIFALAINNGGIIRSSTVSRQGGHIWLTSRSGSIVNSGVLDASATKSGASGGRVLLKGESVSDTGTIMVQGGAGGAGGDVDLSAPKLSFTGSVNLTAQNGKTGSLTIDPATLNVVNSGTGMVVSGQNDSTSLTISPATVQAALNSANLILNANTNITISNAISWTTANTLTLSTNTPTSTININSSITGTSGGLIIATAGATDIITPNSTGAINVGTFTLQNGFWDQNALGGTLAGFAAPTNFVLQNSSEFLRVENGLGTSGNPYLIADVYGLQGIGSPNHALVGTSSAPLSYQQSASFTANTSSWNGGTGFAPIGNQTNPFYGSYEGNNFVISNLNVTNPSASDVAIFGYVGTATIQDVRLSGTSFSGLSYVGGLVGRGGVATITNCISTGSVTGSGIYIGGFTGYTSGGSITSCDNAGVVTGSGSANTVGGLAGINNGTITSSFSTANISAGTGSSEIGGLVGENDGSITKCYATGSVSGSNDVGGLVGNNSSSITLSFASGAVSGYSSLGGLVGQTASGSTITNCYATGSVTNTGGGNDGGLIGDNVSGVVQTCYAYGVVSGGATNGELIGLDSNGTISDSYWNLSAGLSVGIGSSSGTTFTYNGASAPGVTGEYASVLATTAGYDSAWNFTLGTGIWGVNGYNNTGQINPGSNLPFLQAFYTGVASIVPNSQSTTYNRTTVGTGFSATAFTSSGTVFETALPVLAIQGTNTNVGSTNTIYISNVYPGAGYAIELPPSTATESFTPLSITVSGISPASVAYGNTPAFSNDGQSQVISGDTLGGTANYSTTDATSPAGHLNAGSYSFQPSITGYNSNYTIANYVSAGFTITPKPITVSGATIPSVTYGSNPAFSNDGASQVFAGDTLGGTASYSTTDGTSPAGSLNAGTFYYTPSIAGSNSNYSLSYAAASFTINPKPITVSANPGVTATYGSPPAYSHNGESQVLAGDTLGGTATYSNTGTTSPAGYINVGTFNYTPSITGYNPNYTISGYNSASFNVTPLAIAVSANPGVTATYGSQPAFSHNGETQVLPGDTLGGTATFSTTDAMSSAGYLNAGTFSYTPNITGYNSDYTITSFNSASFTVSPLPITVSANSVATTTYGNTPAFSHNGESQVLPGDTLGGSATFSTTDAMSSAGYLNAGTFNYTPLITGYNPNYTISNYNSASFTIAPLPISVSANPGLTITYGTNPNPSRGAPTSSSFSQNGESQVLSGDTLGGIASYSNSGTLSPAGYINVGTFSYTPTLIGYNPNYTITNYNSASFSVVPKPITVSAVSGLTATYGNTPAFSQDGETQVLSGDTLGGTASFSNTDALSAAGFLNAGTYRYTPSLTGNNSNYVVTNLNSASFKINPLSITVSAQPITATYGATPAYGNNGPTQVLSGDTLGGSVTYTNTDSTSSGGYLNAGTYAYSPVLSGYNPNYSVTTAAAQLTINPAQLTVTANHGQTVVYGTDTASGNAGFTYTESGLLAGDSLPISLGGYTLGQTVKGGPYSITESAATNSNYAVVFNSAIFNVTPKPITISAIDLTADPVTYGNNVPFANDAAAGQLVGSDILGGAVSYSTSDSLSPAGFLHAGTFSYSPSISGATNPNYSISFKSANFTINPRAVLISANAGQSIVYGTDTAAGNASLTYTAQGLLDGDSLSGSLGGYNSGLSVAGGPYSITQGNLGNSDYLIAAFSGANFDVSPATLSYVANPVTGVLGLPFPQFTGTVAGFRNGDTLSTAAFGDLTFQTTATSTSPPGLYPIFGSGLRANNYIFTQAAGNSDAFEITEPGTISTFETSSTAPNNAFSNQNGADPTQQTDVFGGDYLPETRRERERDTSSDSTGDAVTNEADNDTVITSGVEDQNGKQANGFSIRSGISGFDRHSLSALSAVPFFVKEHLKIALSREVRDILSDAARAKPSNRSHAGEIKADLVDRDGKPVKGFSIRAGISGFDASVLVPPFVGERIRIALAHDVRDALANAMESQPAGQTQTKEPKTEMSSKMEAMLDQNGHPMKDFFVLPGGAFGWNSIPVPPAIELRINRELDDDVRSVLSRAH